MPYVRPISEENVLIDLDCDITVFFWIKLDVLEDLLKSRLVLDNDDADENETISQIGSIINRISNYVKMKEIIEK